MEHYYQDHHLNNFSFKLPVEFEKKITSFLDNLIKASFLHVINGKALEQI